MAAAAILIVTGSGIGQNALAGWIDTKTGQPVGDLPIIPGPGDHPFGTNYHIVYPDRSDPNRAYDTGRNFARNECGDWIDTKTGERVGTLPIIPGPAEQPFGTNYHIVYPARHDPNRAYDTGRNF